jgi:hypothetical protein
VAQFFGEEDAEADADGLRPVGLAVGAAEGLAAGLVAGLAGGVPDADVDAPVDGVAEPLPDGPPDELPHATRTTNPAITHPPAHHRIRAPPGPVPTDTSMPHRAARPLSTEVARPCGAHPPPITAMLETTERRRQQVPGVRGGERR